MRMIKALTVTATWISILVITVTSSRATVIWNESVNGNLSASQSAPTPFTLAEGTNSIIGTVTGGTDPADWVTLTIPTGLQLSSDVLAAYSSTDQQGFTGVQAGTAFVGNPETSASAYLGYAHFGTGATNGSLPRTDLVGDDLLPIMGNTADAAGSQGFTPPLPSGSYVFIIQQLGAATNYQFDFGVTAVPEPGSLGLLALLGLTIPFSRTMARRMARAVI
jgi:hypothetical protein